MSEPMNVYHIEHGSKPVCDYPRHEELIEELRADLAAAREAVARIDQYNAELAKQLAAAESRAATYRLWLLGFMESLCEVSNIDPLAKERHNKWHGIIRVCAKDGFSELYFMDCEDDVADWCDSPFDAVEWVVEPVALAAAAAKEDGTK